MNLKFSRNVWALMACIPAVALGLSTAVPPSVAQPAPCSQAQQRQDASDQPRFETRLRWNSCGDPQDPQQLGSALSEQGSAECGPDGAIVFHVIFTYQTADFALRDYVEKVADADEVVEQHSERRGEQPIERSLVRYRTNERALPGPFPDEFEKAQRCYAEILVDGKFVVVVYGPSHEVVRAYLHSQGG